MHTYLATTLPMLRFDRPMPFTPGDFAADCRRLLPERDAREVRIALGMEDGPPSSRFLERWRGYEEDFRSECARARAKGLGRHPPRDGGPRAFDSRINAVVARASATEDPLEAERMLLRLRWRILDELSLNREFSLDGILAYGIKLTLLERLDAFRGEDGVKELDALLEAAASSQQAF
jgi:hypothetical protein